MPPETIHHAPGAFLLVQVDRLDTTWTVYQIEQLEPQHTLIYVGVCKTSEVLQLPDARQNNEFLRIAMINRAIGIRFLLTTTDEAAAREQMYALVKQYQPHCNINGKPIIRGARVRCLSTGAIFDNAAAAARFFNVSPTQLSSHLNKKPGFKSVRGLVFEFTTDAK